MGFKKFLDFLNPKLGQAEESININNRKDRVMDIITIIKTAVSTEGISDVHIVAGAPATVRLHGELTPLDASDSITHDQTVEMVKAIAGESQQTSLRETGSCDYAYSYEGRTFRVNISTEGGGYAIAMRLIPSDKPEPSALGLSDTVLELVSRPLGLFLVTGATGSGKSTTLASILQWIASSYSKRIIAIEQPTEFKIDHGRSIVTQVEVPNHVPTFADALRNALRQDPDVIMVGELRDLETIRVALHAAETGHIVLSTLHTNSAKDSIDRICNVFPEGEMNSVRTVLAASLLGILSQVLVPREDAEGRMMAYELMVRNDAVANLIKRDETFKLDNAIQIGSKEGMQLLDDHLLGLVNGGYLSSENALSKARDPKALKARLGD